MLVASSTWLTTVPTTLTYLPGDLDVEILDGDAVDRDGDRVGVEVDEDGLEATVMAADVDADGEIGRGDALNPAGDFLAARTAAAGRT